MPMASLLGSSMPYVVVTCDATVVCQHLNSMQDIATAVKLFAGLEDDIVLPKNNPEKIPLP